MTIDVFLGREPPGQGRCQRESRKPLSESFENTSFPAGAEGVTRTPFLFY